MNRLINEGLSLIEVGVVLIFSCMLLVIGTGYFRTRHLDYQNSITKEHFSEITMALLSYIKINNNAIKKEFFSDGRKPFKLDASSLYPYMISGASRNKGNKFFDGYGNKINILIGFSHNQIYGLLVDDNGSKKIPIDFLSKLETSIGSSAGLFNKNGNTLDGIGESWSFPASSWWGSGVDIENSNLLSIVYDKTFSESEINSLDINKSEAGKISHIDATKKTISWMPLYADDSINVAFHKSENIDYVQYTLSNSAGAFFKANIYSNSFLIKPQPSWVINGENISFVLIAHNKYSNTFSDVYKFHLNIEKQDAESYLKNVIERVVFTYQYSGLKMIDGGGYSISHCDDERDILSAKIKKVSIIPVENNQPGNLLIPIKFRLSYSNVYEENVPLFFYSIFSTNDFYEDTTDSYKNTVDLASGKCSDKQTFSRKSDIHLYLMGFLGSDISVDSKSVNWTVSGENEKKIIWQR